MPVNQAAKKQIIAFLSIVSIIAIFISIFLITFKIQGVTIDRNGEILNSEAAAIDKHFMNVKLPSSEGRNFWRNAMRLAYIQTGTVNAKKTIIVFFDPNCPACAKQWIDLAPHMKNLRVNWIPVGYVKRDSIMKAAAILASEDPAAALEKNETMYNFNTKTGGYEVSRKPPQWAIDAVVRNTKSEVFRKPFVSTPVIVFSVGSGDYYVRYPGRIDLKLFSKIMTISDTAPEIDRSHQLLSRYKKP